MEVGTPESPFGQFAPFCEAAEEQIEGMARPQQSEPSSSTIVVEERVPLVAGATIENKRYLQAKAEKLGHLPPRTSSIKGPSRRASSAQAGGSLRARFGAVSAR